MGGREIVKTKATATGTTLTGGEQIVEGVANETTINDGGIQTVSANGEAIKTKINEGGTLTVNDNGKATDIVPTAVPLSRRARLTVLKSAVLTSTVLFPFPAI